VAVSTPSSMGWATGARERASAVVVRVVMADWSIAPLPSLTNASGRISIGGTSPSSLRMVPGGTAGSAPWLSGAAARSAAVCPSGDRATHSVSAVGCSWAAAVRVASWPAVWHVASSVRRSTG